MSEEIEKHEMQAESTNGTVEKKILILALGGCGANTLQEFIRQPGAQLYETILLDTDKKAVMDCPADHALQGEADWTTAAGQGCGGDSLKGERALARERTRITSLIAGHDFVIVTGGLGGGTATGGIKVVSSVIRHLAIPAIFMMTTPFSFESYSRRNHAEQCLNELRDITEALLVLPNDLLFSTLSPEVSVEAAFAASSKELAISIFGLAELFRSKKLLGPDYAEISADLKKRRNTCSFGCGRVKADEGLDRCSMALERMLESPFLGGMDRLNSSNTLIVSMTGGSDLQIAEMKRTLENLTSLLPDGIQISSGITINPDYLGTIQLTALSIQYEQTPEAALHSKRDHEQASLWSAAANVKEESKTFEQGLLNLQSFSKGIFSNYPPVKYKNEDLDIPTYQRKGIMIDKGHTGK